MKPTSARLLVAVGLMACLTAVVVLKLAYGVLPPLPASAVASLFVVAAAEALTASATRARLAGRPGSKPIVPLAVARQAALARASSLVGVGALGVWTGAIGFLLAHRFTIAVRHDLPVAVAGWVAGAALLAAALWLESVCRIREPPPPRDR